MLSDLISHGRSIVKRLDDELLAPPGEIYPDSRRVPVAESQTWLTAVDEFIATQSSDYIRARYKSVNDLLHDDIGARRGTELERFRRYHAGLLEILESATDTRDPSAIDAPLRSRTEPVTRWDLFISHASEDKIEVARPLAESLVRLGLTVWFDEATLEVGDSLRRSIDGGLANCRYGVVIVSEAFLSKEWPQRELDGLVARETSTGKKAILPVWHRVDQPTVARFSPTLADRLALKTVDGIETVARKLQEVVVRR